MLCAPSQRPTGDAFYDRARDVVAYLLSGIAVSVLVWYAAMLAAWIAWLRGGGS